IISAVDIAASVLELTGGAVKNGLES
ncbi:hypothetical protein A2U01_0102556, partial [Trifolium medium]|nr:hypothetical protein [Trifolium medium]